MGSRADNRNDNREQAAGTRRGVDSGETVEESPVLRLARGIFLAVSGLTAASAPWMLGSHRLPAQWLLFIGAGLTLITGGWLRWVAGRTSSGRRAWRVERIVLLIGLGVLGLMFLQALNPSYRVVFEGREWQLVQLMAKEWAPQSLFAPFDDVPGRSVPFRNAWRYLLIFGLVWMYAAGLAAGFRERRTARAWAWLMGLNGAALALVCLVHRAGGAKLTLWNFSDPIWYQSAPVFFYKNHNGAYLAALTALTFGLAATAAQSRGRWMWSGVGFLLWIATAAVNSRIATAFATLWGLIYLGWCWRTRGQSKPLRRLIVPAVLVVAVAIGLFAVTGANRGLERFSEAGSSPADFVQGGSFRPLLRQVGIAMWWDRPVTGWGGGAFLYLFGSYQSRVPALAAHLHASQPTLNHIFIPYADSDWVEFLVEYGLIGVGLMVLALAVRMRAWIRWRGWRNGLSLFLMFGSLGLVLHAYNDSILRNPALLMLFAGLQVCASRMAAPSDAKPRAPAPAVPDAAATKPAKM